MRRRVLVVLGFTAFAAGGSAIAQGGPDPYELPEPKIRTGDVLRLAATAGCDRNDRVRVRFTPPDGAVFGWFSVELRGREMVRMTGVARAASATVALPRGRSTIRVAGETLGGQRVESARTYRTCDEPPERTAEPPAGTPQRPVQVGGGED
jgi:hypothetical protein